MPTSCQRCCSTTETAVLVLLSQVPFVNSLSLLRAIGRAIHKNFVAVETASLTTRAITARIEIAALMYITPTTVPASRLEQVATVSVPFKSPIAFNSNEGLQVVRAFHSLNDLPLALLSLRIFLLLLIYLHSSCSPFVLLTAFCSFRCLVEMHNKSTSSSIAAR